MEQVKCMRKVIMLTVAAAAASGCSCSASNKADIESGAIVVVVVGEYSLIEPGICVAIIAVL